MKSLCLALALAAASVPAGAQDALKDPNIARNLAATCASCHGTNGHARGDFKPLAGISAGRIFAMLTDFKSGAQPATVMHQIARGYTDEQIKLLASHFAAQQSNR